MPAFTPSGRPSPALDPQDFVKAILVYGVGQVGMKVLDLLSFALLARTLPIESLGFVGTMTLIGFWITDLASLGLLKIGVPRFVIDARQGEREVLCNGFGAFLVYAWIMVVLAGAACWWIAISAGEEFIVPLLFYSASHLMRALVYMELEVLRMKGKAFTQSLLEALPSCLNFGLLAALLHQSTDPLVVSGISQCISWVPLFIGAFVAGVRRGGPRLSMVPELLRYSSPLVLRRSMAEIDRMSGRWVSLVLFGLPGAGAYTFLSRIGDVVSMALVPLQKAWLPLLLRHAHDDKPKVSTLAVLFMWLSLSIFLAFLCASEDIARLVDADGQYSEYYSAIPLMATAGWLSSYYYILGVGFLIEKKVGLLVPISMLAAAVNFGGALVLGYSFGLKSMPIATIASSAIFAGLTQWYSRELYSYERKSVWTAAAMTLGVGCVATGMVFAGVWPQTRLVSLTS